MMITLVDEDRRLLYRVRPYNSLCWTYDKAQRIGEEAPNGKTVKNLWKEGGKYSTLDGILEKVYNDYLVDLEVKVELGISDPEKIAEYVKEQMLRVIRYEEH